MAEVRVDSFLMFKASGHELSEQSSNDAGEMRQWSVQNAGFDHPGTKSDREATQSPRC